jgi:AcrR family transcriptional regulator
MDATSHPPQPPPKGGHSRADPHAAQRRRQLVRAAAHIIESEGLGALRMPRVAEIAGCTRTLVYRYFPSTDDLSIAVASEYFAALEERLDRAAQRRAATRTRPPVKVLESTEIMLDATFDAVAEVGLAGLLLRASPHLSKVMREFLSQRSVQFQQRWSGPVQRSNMPFLHASLITHAGLAILIELVQRWQRDEISRDEAMRLSRTCFNGLVRALQELESH